jgi:hypothetical protein
MIQRLSEGTGRVGALQIDQETGGLAMGGKTYTGGADDLNKAVAARVAAAINASGAVVAKQGKLVITKAGIAALTIANPVAGDDDFNVLEIVSVTAFAHTLDNSAGAGFNAGGAGSDVATFGGAKGDNIRLLAYQGVWYVLAKTNVTLA